jgi:uncharacterized membrane protein
MISFGIIWETILYPLREGSLLWLKVLPLVPSLIGTFRRELRTLQWLTLLLWLYIAEAIVRVSSDPNENLIWSSLWLILSLFTLLASLKAVKKLGQKKMKNT